MGSSKGAHPLNDELLNGTDYDVELFHGPGDKEYQSTSIHCTNFLEDLSNMSEGKHADINCLSINKDHITMAHTQNYEDHWHPTSTEEYYISKNVENSYTGMNKEESRKARGAIEKYIYITAHIITKAIVIYQDILLSCSNWTSIQVSPEPAIQQSKETVSLTRFLFYEIYILKRKEEVQSLFVYWYFVIMFLKEYIKRWADTRFFGHYVYIYGYYVTPLMRYTLDQIYEHHRKTAAESFELFIKRVIFLSGRKYKDAFDDDQKDKIHNKKSQDKLDITLLNKCISFSMNYFSLWFSLDRIYEDNKIHKTESFEFFIKRVALGQGLLFKDYFNKEEKNKILKYDNFDINLIQKCFGLCTKYYKSIIQPDNSKDYLDLNITCKKIKDLRNDNFHNLPEPNINVCINYYQNLKALENSIENIVKLNKKLFPTSNTNIITKYIRVNFLLSKIPVSVSETIVIPIVLYTILTKFII